MAARRRKHAFAILLTVVIALLCLFLQITTWPAVSDIVNRVDGLIYDLRLRSTYEPQKPLDPAIVIVDLDEASLQQEGRWPWPRQKLAHLVDEIFNAGAVLVGLDIVLAEPQENPVDMVAAAGVEVPDQATADWLALQRSALDGDAQLAKALSKGESILGYLFHAAGTDKYGALYDSSVSEGSHPPEAFGLQSMSGYTANLAEFQKSAVGAGFVTVFPDSDGVVRRVPLVLPYEGSFYPSLALQLARQYLLSERIEVVGAAISGAINMTGIEMDGVSVPTTRTGEVLVPYAGRARSFPYVSAASVIHRGPEAAVLEGAIVLIGTSAIGLADLRPTPIMPAFPGVEIHANILRGLLHPEILAQEPDWALGASVVTLTLIGAFFALVFPRMPTLWIPVIGISITLAIIGLNLLLWTQSKISLPLFTPLILTLASTTIFTLEALWIEFSERKKIRESFSTYIPEAHVSKVLESSRENLLEGERREMTVLFADIRNFTALSENLSSKQLKQLLNDYLTPVTRIIFNHGGTIDKYVGDMVMAFWNAPVSNLDHADNAVIAAMEIIDETKRLAPVFASYGIPEFKVGIGINSGEMNVGDMGSEYRLAYTVLGDAVNLGSRLEGLTKFYDLPILVSDTTKSTCKPLDFCYVDRVMVKGREQPLDIFTPVAPEANTEWLAAFRQAVKKYRDQQWKASAEEFKKLCEQFPSRRLLEIYLERATHLAEFPPAEDWDGVYAHIAK